MLNQRFKAARAVLVLTALLSTTVACSAGDYTPVQKVATGQNCAVSGYAAAPTVYTVPSSGYAAAPNVAAGQAMPMDIPQGGG